MKMLLGLFIGMVAGILLALVLIYSPFSARAEEPVVENSADGLAGLLPDFGKIYRDCLGSPFREVESEISDPEIAGYYRKLMEKTGLDRIGLEQ